MSQTVSTRQLVFNYLRDHPIANNEELYRVFPDISQNSIRQYKKQYFDNLKSQVDLDYTPTALERLDVGNTSLLPRNKKAKSLNNHFITLLKTYTILPLFIYAKLYERIKSRYGEYDTDYSYYDLYMEFFDQINSGQFNNNIFEFFSDLNQSYGSVFYEDYEERVYFVDNDRDVISASINNLLELYENPTKHIDQIRIKILELLFFDFLEYMQIPHYREAKYNLRDIHKFCMEYNRVCNDSYDINGLVEYYNDRYTYYDVNKELKISSDCEESYIKI